MTGRMLGGLTFEDAGRLDERSILCLPLGAIEQHGPHLPLDTDGAIASGLAQAIVGRWGEAFDLWQLPLLPFGLSAEHGWASGTMSLSVATMTALLRDLAREIVRGLPVRRLLVVNGHGGNRGILDALGPELRAEFGLTLCTLHLGALMNPAASGAAAEIHGGLDETSVMLALAPDRVHLDRVAGLEPPDDGAIRDLILDPGVSFAWRSDDPRLARNGVIGRPQGASAEHGRVLIGRVVEAAGRALGRFGGSAA